MYFHGCPSIVAHGCPSFRCAAVEISGGNKRSASRLTRGNCGVAPADRPSGTSLPENLEASSCWLVTFSPAERARQPPRACGSRLMRSSRPAELFGLEQPASRARGFGTSLCCLRSTLVTTLPQRRLLRPVLASQFEHRGSGEALGLDRVSTQFCAWIRHDRPPAAKHTSYEHRLSDAHAIQVSFPVEKDLLHANKANTWLPP